MSQERLTRQELGWLLAQEARGAARALRQGVVQLRPSSPDLGEVLQPVEGNLDALDDAVARLSALEAGGPARARRGRIDVAALLCEIAPRARISMEPGAGTEVFGEEGELRRLLHVLVSRSVPGASLDNATPEVSVRRHDDWVAVRIPLGPDAVHGDELERRWVARMAVRHGGRVELEGGMETLYLPADGATDQREVTQLRRELEEAQQLGEAYARELAAVFAAGDEPGGAAQAPSTAPGAPLASRLATLKGLAAPLARALRVQAEGFRAELAEGGSASTELGQRIARRLAAGRELMGELSRLAEVPLGALPEPVDVADAAREQVRAVDERALAQGVEVSLAVEGGATLTAEAAVLRLCLRALLDHAVQATPRRQAVLVRVAGSAVTVSDGGPAVPDGSRAALLAGSADASSLGRPAGISLVVAAAAAEHLGGALELVDASGVTQVRLVLPAGS